MTVTKRKHDEDEDEDEEKEERPSSSLTHAPSKDADDEYEDDDEEKELINVDFDFVDPKDVDYHGLKALLCQTFGTTNNDTDVYLSINVGELATLIISQPHIGSTVKAEGELDPYAIITVINLSKHKDERCVEALRTYILEKAGGSNISTAASRFKELLSHDNDDNDVGWIVNERLINMPPQVVLPAFRMLMEEVHWATEDGEHFDFEYFIVISKTYREVESEVDGQENASKSDVKAKKRKTALTSSTSATSDQVYYFQSEDEIFEKRCECYFDYTFENDSQVSDSRRVFAEMGIEPARKVFLLHRNVMKDVMTDLEQLLVTE